MKHPLHLFTPDRLIPVLFAALTLLTSGCASIHEESCTKFDERGRDSDNSTRYVYSDVDSESAAINFKRLPRGRNVFVRLYLMHLDPPKITPCNYLVIQKDVYIQRNVNTSLALEEIREFYAANGTLIATKTERVGNQFRATGYYTGDTSLPIPPNAPLGKYRIVSKLVVKTKHRVIVLASTSAGFQIVRRK
ncbi:MAG: hypothetical protein ACYDBW_06720 [Sulfuricaulis sp.]